MSILRKIPKIEQVLDNMQLVSLKRLESLMNSGNGATETYTLFGGENKLNYVNKDLGVWYCNIELERNKSVETGFLIWESETKALFISYDITQCLKEYEIDLTNYTYTKINEKLSIEEFRRVLEDNINKEVVHIDTSGNVEIGKNLVVDGKVILNGKEDLVDTSGNVLISDGGGGTPLFNMRPYFDNATHTVSQEGFDLMVQKILNNEIVGISFGVEGICMLLSDMKEEGFSFIGPYQEGYGRLKVTFKDSDLSVKTEIVNSEGSSTNLTLPYTTPTSQVIPSITTSNTQQNLTIGDGLEIKDGALTAKSSGGGSLYFNVAPYISSYEEVETGINGKITQEGFNLLVSKNKNGECIGIAIGDIGTYPYVYEEDYDSSGDTKTRYYFKRNFANMVNLVYVVDGDLNITSSMEMLLNIPTLPSDSETKTYTLKAVNGVLTWVE